MKIEDIQALWSIDSEIKPDLHAESSKVPKLHEKYWKILSHERLILRKLENDLKKLWIDKYEFYTEGPSSQEQIDKGWKLPASGKVLKPQVGIYLEGDQDIIDMNLRICYQNEKIDFLLSILDSINKRSYLLRTMLDYRKFSEGIG